MIDKRIFGSVPIVAAGALVLSAFVARPLAAQGIWPVFVAPESVIDDNFENGLHWGALPDGYKAVVLNAGNFDTFDSVAPDELVDTYRALQSGPLRDFMNRVSAGVSGDMSDTWLFLTDDRTGIGTSTGSFVPMASGGSGTNYVWPNASAAWRTDGSGRVRGRIRVGQHYASTHADRWENTLVHEYFHTQFAPEAFCRSNYAFCTSDAECPSGDTCRFRKTKWGSVRITYGADGSHWVNEMIGGQNLAFEEGLGTFYGTVHTGRGANFEPFWTRTNERYFLEIRSPLISSDPLRNATHSTRDGRYYYKWKDVPGFYLLFAESSSTGFHHFFHKYAFDDRDRALGMIDRSAHRMWDIRRKRDLTYAVNGLALEMEAFAASPEGREARTAGTLTSSMFPFALLDLVTHFGMTEEEYKADYHRNYPPDEPRAWVEYWNHRARVRALAQPHLDASPIEFEEAIRAVRDYFRESSRVLVAAVGGS